MTDTPQLSLPELQQRLLDVELEATTIHDATVRLLARAKAVVEKVTYDESGNMGRGGNGGLLSRDTIRATDELRLELLKWNT